MGLLFTYVLLGFSIALPVGTITYFWYEFIISVQKLL